MAVRSIDDLASSARNALVELEAEVDELLAERQRIARLPRARAEVEAGLLAGLDANMRRGNAIVDECIALAQQRDRDPQGIDLLWGGAGVSENVLALFLEKQLRELIRDRCKSLVDGIADEDRRKRMAQIDSKLAATRKMIGEVRKAAA